MSRDMTTEEAIKIFNEKYNNVNEQQAKILVSFFVWFTNKFNLNEENGEKLWNHLEILVLLDCKDE